MPLYQKTIISKTKIEIFNQIYNYYTSINFPSFVKYFVWKAHKFLCLDLSLSVRNKMSNKSTEKYLHGFSSTEQERLKKQARFAEQTVYKNIDFSRLNKIIEVGSGVGAQTEILLRRFPELNIECIDLNKSQLEAAANYLKTIPNSKGRYKLQEMDATNMTFGSETLDGAFLCWILEHIPNPEKVLSEVRRVLKPGSPIIITEVMNHSFFLEPYSPNVWKYWMTLNDYQHEKTGDPFIGAKLGNLLLSQGYQNINTKIHTWHFDNREPTSRKLYIDFWSQLLLSAEQTLLDSGSIDQDTINNMQTELQTVSKDPNAVFYYSFMQVHAVAR